MGSARSVNCLGRGVDVGGTVGTGVAVGGLGVDVGRGVDVSVGTGVNVGVHVGGKVGGGVKVGTAVVACTWTLGVGLATWPMIGGQGLKARYGLKKIAT